MMKESGWLQEIVKRITSFNGQNPWTIFGDFINMTAFSLESGVKGKKSKEYEALAEKYTKEQNDMMGEMLGCLTLAAEDYQRQGRYVDICGEIYHLLDMQNSKTGQFFTPQHLADATASISLPKDWLECSIEQMGMVYMQEPAAGGGAMILATASRMQELGYDPRRYLYVEASDIDKTCVCMVYVQLMLYGIPAKVAHKDALSREKPWGEWLTLGYIEEYTHIRRLMRALRARERRDIHAESARKAGC